MSKSHLRRCMLELAAAPGGLGTKDIPAFTVKQVGRAADHLVTMGRLFSGRTNNRDVRYFLTSEAAEAYSDAARRRVEDAEENSTGWTADTPVVYLPDYKHTVYPASQMGLFVTNTHKDW